MPETYLSTMIPDNLQLDCSLGDTGMRKMSALSEVATLIVRRTTSVEVKVAFLRKNIIFFGGVPVFVSQGRVYVKPFSMDQSGLAQQKPRR